MSTSFPVIGIMAKPHTPQLATILSEVIDICEKAQASQILIDQACQHIPCPASASFQSTSELAKSVDLIIVIGGDGSLLRAARAAAPYQTPICGINRGRLGFLTDICPDSDSLHQALPKILSSDYVFEPRFLLQASLYRDEACVEQQLALNDVVLHSGHIARMIQFDIFINAQFVCTQRSDGLITATPTGSTAYALSGGGPILHPSLEAITLVPMHPHTLSARPIVVHAQDSIELRISEDSDHVPNLSCDGQVNLSLQVHDKIVIERYEHPIRLIHPIGYNYFSVLRSKLNWGN